MTKTVDDRRQKRDGAGKPAPAQKGKGGSGAEAAAAAKPGGFVLLTDEASVRRRHERDLVERLIGGISHERSIVSCENKSAGVRHDEAIYRHGKMIADAICGAATIFSIAGLAIAAMIVGFR